MTTCRRSQVARPDAQLVVQGGQLGLQRLGARAVALGAVRVELDEPVGHRCGDLPEADGVQPDVRVALGVRLVLVRLVLVRAVLAELDDGQHVERPVVRLLLDRLVDRGLEAGRVDDEVGLADRADLARRQLEVVRLAPRLGQVGHVDGVAADPRGDELVRVEADDRRHRRVLLTGGRAGHGAAAAPGQGEGGGGGEGEVTAEDGHDHHRSGHDNGCRLRRDGPPDRTLSGDMHIRPRPTRRPAVS